MEIGKGDGTLRLDENGNPIYRFNPLLADLSAHVRMMDKAGIDVAVLSCGSGFDQPNLARAETGYRGPESVRLAGAPLADPKLKARVADLGATVFAGSQADFRKFLADETEKWAKVIKFKAE